MIERIRHFVAWPLYMKIWLIQGIYFSAYLRFNTCLLYNKKIYQDLREAKREVRVNLTRAQRRQVNEVKHVIAVIDQLVFWKNTCLVQAMTARWILKKAKIPIVLYMGVTKDEKGQMLAHAWTKSGNIEVTGGQGEKRFTVTGIFY